MTDLAHGGHAPATTADRLVQGLETLGVEIVFGIPGVHTLPLYDALQRSPLRHVLACHEQGADFMADGYARTTGRYAACFLVSGTGVMNAATAIGQAHSDSVPMLVVATVNRRGHLGLGLGELHEMRDQRAAMAGLVETALSVSAPEALDQALLAAHVAAATGRRRPAFIELPLDVLASGHAAKAPLHRPVMPPPVPPAAALDEASALLARGRRPLVLVGGGAAGAATELRAIVERLGAITATTIAGKGIVPDRAAGALGGTLRQPEARALAAEADVVLVVGSELASRNCGDPAILTGKPLIRIDLSPASLNRPVVPSLALQGDAATTLALLLDRLPERNAEPGWVDPAAGANAEARARRLGGREHQGAFLEALRAALADDAIVVTDMTQIAYTGNVVYEARQPATWLHPAGFGTLGWALPAAIGAKLGRPERDVVALIGDYGLGFTSAELRTAADLGLPLPVLVWNNAKPLDVIREMGMAGIERPIGTAPGAVDLAALAKAHGCAYAQLGSAADVAAVLRHALAADSPTIVDVDARADIGS